METRFVPTENCVARIAAQFLKLPKLAVLLAMVVALACAALIGPAPAFAAGSSSASSSKDQVTLTPAQYSQLYSSAQEVVNTANNAVLEIRQQLSELVSTLNVALVVLGFLGVVVTALVLERFFRRQTSGAAEMLRKSPKAVFGAGVLGAIVIPLLVILLTVLCVTWPLAGGLAFAALSLSSVAAGFMGTSLFRLVFKNMGRYKRALAGGAIVGVAIAIPYLGIAVEVLAFVYLLGYVLQSARMNMRKSPSSLEPPADEQDNEPGGQGEAPGQGEAHADGQGEAQAGGQAEPHADEQESGTDEALPPAATH